jgi:alpha-glucoside transport system permease protein
VSSLTQAKLTMLLYGVVAFLAVVGLLLLVVDRAPKRGREKIQLAAFLAPAVVLLSIGLVIPAIRTTLLSFKGSSSESWVGFDNYTWMLTTDASQRILLNTAIWVLLAPVLATAIGLLYAIVIDKARTEALAKALVFMPMAISLVGASIIWKLVYTVRPATSDQIGLANQLLVMVGLEPQRFLQDPPWNTLFLVVIMIWIQAGFAMVILSAAIKAVSADVIEAARLDGVNAWQMFRNVTLPSIRPAVVVVMVTISIATLKAFDIVRTTTGGNFETGVVATEMYDQAFRFAHVGRGSALAVLLFVLVLPIVVYQVRVLRSQKEIR